MGIDRRPSGIKAGENIVVTYYPASDRGASLVLFNGLADTGADAAANLIREFLLKGITTHMEMNIAS
jgi:hypothetical protein